ncbi:CHRD domain-containing protein [Agromyces sp. CCNWLW203]|uniref:CHRD domain-containing protein n=1 Tax=Agromyces sp. CCNWLW203 TaxID=3112842 RepID=UPI002F96A19B
MITTTRTRTAALGLTAIAALAFAGAGAAATAHAAPPGAPAIPLTSGQETPRPTDGGGAHGSFSYEIDGDELCYSLEVSGLSTPAVAAHVHLGDRNVAGPVVVPLVIESATDFDIETCVPGDPEVLAAIEADPSNYYINVHTTLNPPGEVRGQLK